MEMPRERRLHYVTISFLGDGRRKKRKMKRRKTREREGRRGKGEGGGSGDGGRRGGARKEVHHGSFGQSHSC